MWATSCNFSQSLLGIETANPSLANDTTSLSCNFSQSLLGIETHLEFQPNFFQFVATFPNPY